MGKVVVTAAIMDMCHQGHINLLKQMRKEAGEGLVIVVLHDDKSCFEIKGKFPIQSLEHRMKNVLRTELVDKALYTFSTDPAKEFKTIFNKYKDDELVFMRGDDNKDFPGKHVVTAFDIPIKYVTYTKDTSSTKIREYLSD